MTTNSYNNESDEESNSSSSSGGPRLTIGEGLSKEALAALAEYQQFGFFSGDDDAADDDDGGGGNDNDNGADASAASNYVIQKNQVCPTFTAGDTKVIADTLRRLSKNTKADALLSPRIILDLEDYSCEDAILAPVDVLRRDGFVRINGVLDPELCDQCLKQINEELEQSGQRQHHDSTKHANVGFGNVFSRANRYDMYLRKEGVYEQSLGHMLQHNSILACLFDALLEGESGVFHEFAALVSDPGSGSQPTHPDSKYTEVAPMWTVFCALQDVDLNMGPTTFLPGTATRECHERLTGNMAERDELLGKHEYRRSVLKKGDAAVMDSRTWHFGGPNVSDKRRVLFYFTIRNPLYVGEYPPEGSLWPSLSTMTTKDFFLDS